MLSVSDFVTGEINKIKNGEVADGDISKLFAELDEFRNRIKEEIKEQGVRLPRENKNEEPK